MKRFFFLFLCLAAWFTLGCGDDDEGTNNNNQAHGVCGDGNQDPDEQCDDGAANSDVEPDACRTDCRLAYCGDGVTDSREECDDGNTDNQDDCLTTCFLNVCGDGYVNLTTVDGSPVEQCDDGNTEDDASCRADCQQDMTLCGNGQLDPGEGCDEAPYNSDTEADACRLNCQVAGCGDGVMDTGEECDCGSAPEALAGYCTDVNGGADANCSASCVKLAYCGDGIEDPGEECDDGAANSDTEPDACRTDCTTAWCGDGVVDSAEYCDGNNLDGETCESQGFSGGGTLGCSSACDFDTSQCSS